MILATKLNTNKIDTMIFVFLRNNSPIYPMKTIKLATSLILILLCMIGRAQNIDANRKIMNQIIMDPEHYFHATAVADSFDLAVKDAVGMLAAQIKTNVESESTTTMSEQNLNGDISSLSYFSNVIKTFTDVSLTGYQSLMIGKPTKKTKKYTAFVYISSERVAEIIEELKQAEIKKAQEKERLLKNDINFYYDEGLRAINEIRIGDALKYFYWGYLLASDTKMELERNGKKQPADAVFSLLLDQTLSNISVVCEEQKQEKINETQSLYVKQLGFYFKTEENNYRRITCLDFKYHNGNTYIEGPRVRDGVSVAELLYNLAQTNIHCTYNYDSSETPPQLQETIKNKKSKTFASADKLIIFDNNESKEVIANNIEPIAAKNDSIETPEQNCDTSRLETLTEMMANIENAIRNKSYGYIADYFTENGYDCFNKLIRYGNASIIGQPHYDFVAFENLVICRSITMQFRFKNNKKFVENVVFRFNEDNQIESLAFALTEIAQHDIMDNEEWNRDSRLTLLSFMEDYQTAYALRRIDYLERIFSENALIISGYKVYNKESSDGIRLQGYTHYDTLSKSQYMAKLRRHFKTKEYINLNFTETEFKQAWNTEDFFGVRVRQEYFSSNYGDVGYLFLLVDLREKDPVIHVRAWQDDKIPVDQLFSLKDVY